MRISDWSSDVCSSDLCGRPCTGPQPLCCESVTRTERGAFTMRIATIGLDLAKSVFQAHGVDENGATVLVKKLHRKQMLPFFSKLSPCLIGLEACGTAHYWARTLAEMGHEVRLIPPSSVRAYVQRGKSDAHDAKAICERANAQPATFEPQH